MKPEEEIILILSRPRPSGDARDRVRDLIMKGSVDYERLLRLASGNGVSPFIFRNLRGDEGMPGSAVDRLKTAYYQSLKRNLGQLNETLRIICMLADAGIGTVPLKGPLASEQFFGDAGKYPSSDIDILVRPADLDRARQVLEKAGYRNEENIAWEDLRTSTYHEVLTNGGFYIELHWNLAMRYFRVDPEFWWQKTFRSVHDGLEIELLAPERYLLYLIFRAFAKGFFPLKFLVLAAGLTEVAGKDLEWDDFFAHARKLGMGRLADFILSFLCNELGVECPKKVASRRSVAFRLFRGLVLSGLFGPGRRVHLRMLLYTLLLQSPDKSMSVLIRRLFPPFGEILLRYGLPAGSKTVYLYYILNPILLATRKQKTVTRIKDKKVNRQIG
jgi:Uncharacterised nucleotidyltransferase